LSAIQPIKWDSISKILTLLDQTRLPLEEAYVQYSDPDEVAVAIRDLVVRGAPAIGCAAAYGVALAAIQYTGDDPAELAAWVRDAMGVLAQSRPTAVNLFWALERMGKLLDSLEGDQCGKVTIALEQEAVKIFEEDLDAIVSEQTQRIPETYALTALHVTSGTNETPTADVTLTIDGQEKAARGEGDGPVDAAYRTIAAITGTHSRLSAYIVQAISGGTDAQGSVTVKVEDAGRTFTGQGADPDIVIASARAYLNALNKAAQWHHARARMTGP